MRVDIGNIATGNRKEIPSLISCGSQRASHVLESICVDKLIGGWRVWKQGYSDQRSSSVSLSRGRHKTSVFCYSDQTNGE
jgi:hypothetical protein